MATQLAIVNQIQRRLRETITAAVNTSSYSALLGDFVNDAVSDMEEMDHEWSVYHTEIDTTVLADGTTTYDLTGTTDRSVLQRNYQFQDIPQAFDITTDKVAQLFDCPYKELLRHRNLSTTPTQTVDTPITFSVVADADGRGWTLELLWGADNARSWRTYWYVPQGILAVDGTADSTEIKLPRNPVYYRALYYAANERGEEMGEPNGILWQQSVEAIGSAMERDQRHRKQSEGNDWTNEENL